MTLRHSNFNSPVEIGTRVALILVSLDQPLCLDDLVILDYALLYSKEFGGPDNLHPALPNHIAEIAHRREVMPKSLSFLSKRGLMQMIVDDTGYYYSANESTTDFVSCLRSPYYKKSWVRLNWISENREKVLSTKILELKSLL
ncbi:ABC-three component system middle component 2 [Pseudoalteromonas carrageenovora]|uniref:ABC-three component system middle component 2 n=1 Tax=Pseudoalteromonas carrageenovora TaxID=227 RepID=UPI00349F4A92